MKKNIAILIGLTFGPLAYGEVTPEFCEKELLDKVSVIRKVIRNPKVDRSEENCLDEASTAADAISHYSAACENIELDEKRPLVKDVLETFRSFLTHRERWTHANTYAFNELREMLEMSLVYPIMAKCIDKHRIALHLRKSSKPDSVPQK